MCKTHRCPLNIKRVIYGAKRRGKIMKTNYRWILYEENRTNDHASVLRIVSRLCMKTSNCIMLVRH